MRTEKRKKALNLIRSATAPETIVAAVHDLDVEGFQNGEYVFHLLRTRRDRFRQGLDHFLVDQVAPAPTQFDQLPECVAVPGYALRRQCAFLLDHLTSSSR